MSLLTMIGYLWNDLKKINEKTQFPWLHLKDMIH